MILYFQKEKLYSNTNTQEQLAYNNIISKFIHIKYNANDFFSFIFWLFDSLNFHSTHFLYFISWSILVRLYVKYRRFLLKYYLLYVVIARFYHFLSQQSINSYEINRKIISSLDFNLTALPLYSQWEIVWFSSAIIHISKIVYCRWHFHFSHVFYTK